MQDPDEWQPTRSGWQRRDDRERRELEPIPEWAEELTRWLDSAVRVPGTKITIGLDAILGFLLPTAGDALTAVGALSLFSLAVRYRVPKIVMLKMLVNIAIDAILGSVPLVGDVFDVAWRANRRNLELIQRYRTAKGAPATAGDYVFVGLALVVLLALLVLPILVFFVVARRVAEWMG